MMAISFEGNDFTYLSNFKLRLSLYFQSTDIGLSTSSNDV